MKIFLYSRNLHLNEVTEFDIANHDSEEKYADFSEHTLNGYTKVSLVLSSSVGDHTGVLPLMGQHGVLYEEEVATLLNAGMDVSSQQLKTKKIHEIWSRDCLFCLN